MDFDHSKQTPCRSHAGMGVQLIPLLVQEGRVVGALGFLDAHDIGLVLCKVLAHPLKLVIRCGAHVECDEEDRPISWPLGFARSHVAAGRNNRWCILLWTITEVVPGRASSLSDWGSTL